VNIADSIYSVAISSSALMTAQLVVCCHNRWSNAHFTAHCSSEPVQIHTGMHSGTHAFAVFVWSCTYISSTTQQHQQQHCTMHPRSISLPKTCVAIKSHISPPMHKHTACSRSVYGWREGAGAGGGVGRVAVGFVAWWGRVTCVAANEGPTGVGERGELVVGIWRGRLEVASCPRLPLTPRACGNGNCCRQGWANKHILSSSSVYLMRHMGHHAPYGAWEECRRKLPLTAL
jgi:hypothetical protein